MKICFAAVIRTTGLLAFILFVLASFSFAQEVPCPDARSRSIEFTQVLAKSVVKDCRGRQSRIKLRVVAAQVVMISGHVTRSKSVV